MRALVTGGTGFVGSHVVRALLDAGHSVRVLHRATSKRDALAGLDVESLVGSLLDPESLRAAADGVDWVFQVAAVADYWRADRSAMFAANVTGTQHVLAAARDAGVRRVVLTSSAAAVGFRADGTPADESLPFNLPPQHFPYGYSKALAERAALDAHAAGLDVVIVNPVVVLGPGDRNLISGSFITQTAVYRRLTPLTSGGVAVVDVRDVARWHLRAAEVGQNGRRYILGTANLSYADLFARIAAALNVGRPVFSVPDALIPWIAAGNDWLRARGVETPVDADQVRLSTRDVFFRFDAAWEAFGPPQVDVDRCLRDAVAWYRQAGLV